MNMSRYLAGISALRVFTTATLKKVAYAEGCTSDSMFFGWKERAEECGHIARVNKGLSVNGLAHPSVHLDECAGFIRSGSVVSLQTVLADCGALNNYTSNVSCVVPKTCKISSMGRVRTDMGSMMFYHESQDVVFPDVSRDLIFDGSVSYARATPEKALSDWIYLGSSPSSHLHLPPHDIDMDFVNTDGLLAISSAMRIKRHVLDWLEGNAGSGEELSTDFGF